MSKKELEGKTVKEVETWIHGHYDYTGYILHFTDGTKAYFSGNSDADVEIWVCPPDTKEKPT
jgi:hypothetical protein